MDISALQVAQVTSQSPSASSNLAADFDTFLQLLTTQLQNQDPLDPLNTEQFTQQLVQFAGVEQSIQTNDHLETLIGLQSAADRDGAFSLIGKSVSIAGSEAQLSNTAARWSYVLPDNAATVDLQIVDNTGDVVARLVGARTAGSHDVVWDGLNDDGSSSDPGAYQLRVTATDTAGATVTAETFTTHIVDGVIFTEDGPRLETALGAFALNDVRRVRNQ